MARRQWRILIVDKDTDYVVSLKPFLEAKLGRVLWAKSERQAQAILDKEEIDLILLEIMLAEPDGGLRWCRNLKADGRFDSVPVFLLSCVDERFSLGLKNKLGENGYCPAEGFLDKSTQPAEIVTHLEKFLRSHG
ncbi:MAG: response regulator [Actinobacteria bacterium]|nr:response regulator [Actinomycetota bacterium]